MTRTAVLVALLALLSIPYVEAATTISYQEYFQGLDTALKSAGLNQFINALSVANQTADGQRLVGSLYSNSKYTVYAPVDSAWEAYGSGGGANLVSVLSYHIVAAQLNSSRDIAPSRQHTIAFTQLHADILLPGNQNQVMVLQHAENSSVGASPQDTVIEIRGDSWNATSTAAEFIYDNLYIQPIDTVLKIPNDNLDTLASDQSLAIEAQAGATSFLSFAAGLGLTQTLTSCKGCTFLVPVDAAFQANQTLLNTLSSSDKTAVLNNHFLNQSLMYSTMMHDGDSIITASGETLAYIVNDQGEFFTSGDYKGRVLRFDIPVENGVMHLIDGMLIDTLLNPSEAAIASVSIIERNVIRPANATMSRAASALSQATKAKEIDGVIGTITSSSTATSTARVVSAARRTVKAKTKTPSPKGKNNGNSTSNSTSSIHDWSVDESGISFKAAFVALLLSAWM
ncbi:hypothetical protein P7C73_g1225, partial [Tremellales sp. Uapishka_1]